MKYGGHEGSDFYVVVTVMLWHVSVITNIINFTLLNHMSFKSTLHSAKDSVVKTYKTAYFFIFRSGFRKII